MGNCTTALPRNLKCYHEKQKNYCETCDRNLCLRCKERHLEKSHIVLCKKCTDEEKEYLCITCECSLCVQCKKLHIRDRKTKNHDIIQTKVLCRHENKGFYCNICERCLCVQCKERHDQDKDTKHHGIIFKLINRTHKEKKYDCSVCECGVCVQCQDRKVVDLSTKSHEVVITQESIEKETKCEIHPEINCDMWCLSCKRPVCFWCLEQSRHEIMELEYAYKSFREYHRDRIVRIKNKTLQYNQTLLAKMCSNKETEINNLREKLSNVHIDMSNRLRTLKDYIDIACKVKTERLHQSKLYLRQRHKDIVRYFLNIKRYENKYIKSAKRTVEFLLFLKKTAVPKLKDKLDVFTVSFEGTFEIIDAVKLFEVRVKETRKRQVDEHGFLKRMPTPLFLLTLIIPNVYDTYKDKKYDCRMCECGLCVQCQDRKVVDLNTKSHEVVITQELLENETKCEIYPEINCDLWCLSCKRPVCFWCLEQSRHEIMELEYAYKTLRKYHRDRIISIRKDILPYNRALLAKMCYNKETEINTLRKKLSNIHVDISERLRTLKDYIDKASKVKKKKMLLSKRDLRQRHREIVRNFFTVERYENKYLKYAHRPVECLLFLKKTAVPELKDIFDVLTVSLEGTIEMTDAIKLFKIQVIETRKRQVKEGDLLEMMLPPLFLKTLIVPSVYRVRHISLVTSGRFWVSDGEDLLLVDTSGRVLHTLTDISSYGGHTCTSDGNLIYIDKDYNINKLSKSYTTATLLKKMESWRPHCIYCSPTTAELLVGMRSYDKNTHRYTAAKVVRYNSAGNQVQTIKRNSIGQNLYSAPNFIIENRNGDVIVADWHKGIVVTDREGQHRFFHRGINSEFIIERCGICTDALSNILVCDLNTHTVQLFDKNGCFLCLLLRRDNNERIRPWSLSYDYENHLLWVGSRDDQRICVYRYLRKQDIPYADRSKTPTISPVCAEVQRDDCDVASFQTTQRKKFNNSQIRPFEYVLIPRNIIVKNQHKNRGFMEAERSTFF